MLAQDDLLAELGGKLTLKLLSQLVVERNDGGDVEDDDVVLVLDHLVIALRDPWEQRNVLTLGHHDDELDHVDGKLLEDLMDYRRTRILVDGVVREHVPETRVHAHDLLHLLELSRNRVHAIGGLAQFEQDLGICLDFLLDEQAIPRH